MSNTWKVSVRDWRSPDDEQEGQMRRHELVNSTDEVIAALRWAMDGERRGYRFYIEAAERSADPVGKNTFRNLASAEQEHLLLLFVEHESLNAGRGWVDPEEALTRQVKLDISKPLFPGDEEASEGAGSPFGDTWAAYETDGMAGDLAALEFGMEMERRFYKMYAESAAEAASEGARRAYEFLMNEENEHFKLLQDAHSYLGDNKHWWDEDELPFFEG